MDKQSQGAWITSCKLFMSSLEWNSISTDSDLGPGSRNGPCSGLGSTPHFSWILWKEGVWPVCVFEEKCKLSLSFFSASSINDAEERFSHVQQVFILTRNILTRNQYIFLLLQSFPAHTTHLTDPGVLSKQNYHCAWCRTNFLSCPYLYLVVAIVGVNFCLLGVHWAYSHSGRRVEMFLPLGPAGIRASNLTKTKVQQDAQRKV